MTSVIIHCASFNQRCKQDHLCKAKTTSLEQGLNYWKSRTGDEWSSAFRIEVPRGGVVHPSMVFCCLAGHWLPWLWYITNICLQLISLLFHIPRICCSSTVVSFSLLYISQSSCLLECLAITHHVGEHALAICVSVDLSRWWYICFPRFDSEPQSYWLLLSSWSSPSFSISTFQKLRFFS